MNSNFDREWRIEELLDQGMMQRVGPALNVLLGGDAAIVDADGHVLWGIAVAEARREPLVLELEPVAYLASQSADQKALAGARTLLELLLRTQVRYKMASNLHLEAVAEDFESLRLEHARLQESEARYKALSGELEARVRAQVLQLEERQQMLYSAEKLASVGQLAAGVAHEVNNPLGFVRSNLATFQHYLGQFGGLKARLGEGEVAWQALDLDFVLEDGGDLLAESLKGIDRIAKIVSELKSFSNVDRASEEFLDLNDCLRQAASVIEGQLPPGVSLRLELLPLPGLVCLPGHINQMLLGLLRNAGQAISEAGRPGEIGVSSAADEQGITIHIRDNGVGMTAEQLARAFEPFYTTRPVGAGAGLGLTTARNIVLAHSGRIDLVSYRDVGTTVTLFFPLPK
ncbi:sensor histidine kinase [Dechloromonas denitrificans]|uniref:sensor histidine kinase n=1 Tax=Dechloromonas denitrificans TaxID=281362 RepID=UPI001CF83A78|nr:ATP-binding protein [Dechloromonas denitrificans]UCV01857.1 two-component sensor histidine kinase [Dechloromonas denitrificans]UCV06208.1 two-component sensor histidine kinase [Dechloromonas denitrificans]